MAEKAKVYRPKTIVYTHRVLSFRGFHLFRVILQDTYGQFTLWTIVRGNWAGLGGAVCRMVQMGPEDREEGQFAQWTAEPLRPYKEMADRLEAFNRRFAISVH